MRDDIVIREAQPEDVAEIVRHRRRMYEHIGERDAAALDAMQDVRSRPKPRQRYESHRLR